MRFGFRTEPGKTFIKAVLEEGDSPTGRRQEGPGTEITLQTTVMEFDYEVREIHPDLLGLACMIMFYPFIGRSVTFPMPVSSRLTDAFRREAFTKTKELEFTNIDDSLERYSGSDLALSFGGGVDSSSVRAMFPEAFVVHEGHIVNGRRVPSRTAEVVDRLAQEGRGRVVWSNQRYVSRPGGWHSWPAPTAPSLLMAADKGFGALLMGANLGSAALNNGSKYYDRHEAMEWHGPSGNLWQHSFWEVGLPMFTPIGGMSEILTYQIATDAFPLEDIEWCTMDDGRQCQRCTKCFRRAVIGRSLGRAEPDWEPFRNDDVIELLRTRPLYFGHIFSTAMAEPRRFPRWVRREMRDLPSVDWTYRHNPEMADFFPDEWRDLIQGRVEQFSGPMTSQDLAALKAWDQTGSKRAHE